MALIDTLATELLGPKSVRVLSEKAQATPQQVQETVTAALPLLLSGMLQNSGTQEGAASLDKALAAHAPAAEKSTAAMLSKADGKDGKKILAHILGDDQSDIVKGLSRSTGLSQKNVTTLLSQLAPVVLSLVGSHKEEEQQAQASSPDLVGLLGSALLGGGFQQAQASQQSGLNLTGMAASLLGSSGSTSSGGLSSLLGGLLGSGSSSQSQQQSSGGLDLSGLLMGLLK